MRFKFTLGLLATTTLLGCGGSGSSSSPPPQPTQTGVFLDSPVAGLAYSTPGQQGVTNSRGEFIYRSGETVTFSLGNTVLGSATGAPEVTPLSLIQAADIEAAIQSGTSNRLTNTLLLLQSLDADGNPENGIDLNHLTDLEAALDLDMEPSAFQNLELRPLVNQFSGQYRSPKEVTNHLLRSLGQSVTVSLPLRSEIDFDGDGDIETTVDYIHDALGRVTEITTESTSTGITRLEYNEQGLLAKISDENDSPLVSIPGIPNFSPFPSGLYETVYEYDSQGRVTKITFLRNEEVVSETVSEYDDVGNLLRRTVTRLSFSLQPLNSYFQYYLFAVGAVPPPTPIISPLPTGDLTGIIRGGGILPIGGLNPQPAATVSVTEFEYDDLGTVLRQVLTLGDQEFETTFDSEDDRVRQFCQAVQGAVPSPFNAATITAGCADGVEFEVDELGRLTTITINTTTTTNIDRFTYEGALLVSQTTSRESSDGEVLSSFERRFVYNSSGDLVEATRLENGEVTYRLTRTYETVELEQLP